MAALIRHSSRRLALAVALVLLVFAGSRVLASTLDSCYINDERCTQYGDGCYVYATGCYQCNEDPHACAIHSIGMCSYYECGDCQDGCVLYY